jgi:hypothetical protein
MVTEALDITLSIFINVIWRRDRDSNPGWACTHNGFRDRPVRPLRHLSTEAADNPRWRVTQEAKRFHAELHRAILENDHPAPNSSTVR